MVDLHFLAVALSAPGHPERPDDLDALLREVHGRQERDHP
jgi:hypothetical protein